MIDKSYREHELVWNEETIRRFWEFHADYAPYDDNYFTKKAGQMLVDFAASHAPLRGRVLDYGTGKGHLIEYLLQLSGCVVAACEYSKKAVDFVNSRYRSRQNFLGCFSLEGEAHLTWDGSFNAIFVVEIIEHLDEVRRDAMLNRLSSMMSENGFLILTTPNEEHLEEYIVLCPECGAKFHRVQHLCSYSREGLQRLLESYGIETLFCDAVNLDNYRRDRFLIKQLKRVIYYSQRHVRPNLIYIGMKRK